MCPLVIEPCQAARLAAFMRSDAQNPASSVAGLSVLGLFPIFRIVPFPVQMGRGLPAASREAVDAAAPFPTARASRLPPAGTGGAVHQRLLLSQASGKCSVVFLFPARLRDGQCRTATIARLRSACSDVCLFSAVVGLSRRRAASPADETCAAESKGTHCGSALQPDKPGLFHRTTVV